MIAPKWGAEGREKLQFHPSNGGAATIKERRKTVRKLVEFKLVFYQHFVISQRFSMVPKYVEHEKSFLKKIYTNYANCYFIRLRAQLWKYKNARVIELKDVQNNVSI